MAISPVEPITPEVAPLLNRKGLATSDENSRVVYTGNSQRED